jgi:hypothetical protein
MLGAVAIALAAISAPVAAGDDGDAKLVEIEKSLWAGWAAADTKPFEKHLVKEVINMVSMGFTFGKEQMLKDIGSSDCKVAGYNIGDIKVIRPADKVAILAYSATQDAVCGDYRVPGSVHVTSTYVKKDGDWKNASYAETPAAR